MSLLLHSESDSSSDSLASMDPPAEEAVPLSTSIILQKAKVSIDPPSEQKISVRFQPIGSAPAINPLSFTVSGSQTIGSISKFLMRRLRLKSVHVYVSSSFQPTPDEKLGDLHGMFRSNGELILSYCETIAFG